MQNRSQQRTALSIALALVSLAATDSQSACAAEIYQAINPTMAAQTITLTGQDLTIDQVVAVARYGAKVALSRQARQRSADRFGILLEGAAEGMSIYRLNRQAGAGREIVTFTGDPMSPQNKSYLEQRELRQFRNGAGDGFGPEVADEDIVRATMLVRLNSMTYAAVSPQVTQMLLDLLNERVTPVIRSRGSVGEADLNQMDNIKGTMVGAGDAYLNGVRMSAAEALAKAGLTPVQPFGADNDTLDVSNSFATGQAALLVADARRALEWADLAYAIDENGMNSSITPLTSVVQAARPFRWLNWDAARVLQMLKGSYLFNDDPKRIIQDPESLRASSIRQASAWEAWGVLRDDVTTQINSSDNNPAVAEGSPSDSWELGQPMMMRYYVKGGALSHGKHGYVFSNANWDPYPLANDVESLTLALGNMDIAVMLRQAKFATPFFTVVQAREVMPGVQGGFGGGTALHDVMQHIQALMAPVSPEGYSTDIQQVEELDAQSVLKVVRARSAVDETMRLLSFDVITGTFWMDARKAQDPTRQFGAAPTAAWAAFRQELPLQRAGAAGAPPPSDAPPPREPAGNVAYRFLMQHPAFEFYPNGPPMPAP